ncbi:MAG: type II toxin-antitoxin system VapC family toxin [Acidobacteriota bacterium]|nr:type II toxin-antitoxin system VapC family toxin [Acidobacteriota bacterium]
MIAIDTNILIRIIYDDNEFPEQSATARALMEKESEKGIFISVVVLLETVWVLRSRYKIPKLGIVTFLKMLMDTEGVVIERREQVIRALRDYEIGGAGFADYLILASARDHKCDTVYTFETRRLARDPRVNVLEAQAN